MAQAVTAVRTYDRIGAFVELMKPRLGTMVVIMTALGYFLGAAEAFSWTALAFVLLGSGLVTSGSLVLNNYLERDVDGRMERTKNRALPSGRVTPQAALSFGVIMVLGGCAVLIAQINLLTAFLALLSAFLYVIVYTPMKRLSWLNTSLGAIPGALPPMGGWAAATGQLDPGAWILFAIMYCWQHPHFFAIAWMYRDEYAKAGFKMLPVVDPSGRRTFRQSLFFLVLLIPAALAPTLFGISGWFYAVIAVAMSLAFLATGIALVRTGTHQSAKRMLHASLVYLPLLFTIIVIDATL